MPIDQRKAPGNKGVLIMESQQQISAAKHYWMLKEYHRLPVQLIIKTIACHPYAKEYQINDITKHINIPNDEIKERYRIFKPF